MIKKITKTLVAIAVACVLPLSAQAQPVTLKLSFFGPAAEASYDRVIRHWVDAVNKDPAGALKIDAFPNGALGKVLPAQPQLVLDGVADIAFINPGLTPGRFPDDQILELPGLFRSFEEAIKTYQALTEQNVLRGYEEYVVLGSFMNLSYNLFGRKPMRNLADLKGLKVRIVGATIGQTVKEFGMVPVLMPPNEIAEAMGRGTVDAATVTPTAVVDFGLERVANNDFMVPLGHGPLAVVMSRKKYEALSPEAKAQLKKYDVSWFNALFIRAMGDYHNELVARFKTDSRRKVAQVSAADQLELNKVFEKVTAEWAGKNERNAQVLAKTREILAGLR
jgi:TRAP-type C4-dicarboxylate transport system substrate-binding protein